jgi:hypothetical protein
MKKACHINIHPGNQPDRFKKNHKYANSSVKKSMKTLCLGNNETYDRLQIGDVKYHFVIDMAFLKK